MTQATVGYDGRGKRIVRKGTGKSETAALRALRERIKEYEAGLVVGADRYTVKQAVEEWLQLGHARTSARTLEKDTHLAKHVIEHLGARKVKDLRPDEVERWLRLLAGSMTNRTLADVRSVLNRSVKRAMAHGMVTRNVVELVETPRGRAGRGSRSMTMQEAADVLTLTAGHPMHAYIVVSLVTGLRTEEVRALRWDHVDLEGDPDAGLPPSVAVWRSVRMGGDTKTAKSRRTIALSGLAVAVLKRHRTAQTAARFAAGSRWQESGLVFTSQVGTVLDASNVRDLFRDALALVPGIEPAQWTPRDLRHSFASIMSERGVPLEEISRLLGHSGTAVTEAVYRKELRPVIQTGAQVMDAVFAHVEADPVWVMEPLFGVAEAMGEPADLSPTLSPSRRLARA
ncbi:tyrosine recombinase XerC [uncultured Cellulomonas sp.]|uniref:site-specific integrase n=1 Tax=uncultured Cellulomonas sp. TaxID=189682 RepID=UPI00261D6939|nr:site-specific integrase [uncultured Cellulomonas sp.]